MEDTQEQNEKSFYGLYYEHMLRAKDDIIDFISKIRGANQESPVEYCISRIKKRDSAMLKLRKRGLPENSEAAITKLTDIVGIRVICGFLSDVYLVAQEVCKAAELRLVCSKDYIAAPKSNGYRSFHVVTSVPTLDGISIPVEIQIRTISQDSWANLEHQMKYKKDISNEKLIQKELKRCADEMASTDISMQTIKELIAEQPHKV